MASLNRALGSLKASLRDGVMQDEQLAQMARNAADDTRVTDAHRLIVHLGSPASESALATLTQACWEVCGFALPPDLRALYSQHNGIWTELRGPGERSSAPDAPPSDCLVSAERLVEVLSDVHRLMPQASTRILPFYPQDDIRWHGYLSPRSIAYFSLEMEQATLAAELAEWLEQWVAHGFADWSGELPNELEVEGEEDY